MALTATANKRTMKFITDNLDMDECTYIRGTNNKENVFYSVSKLLPCTPQDVEKQYQLYKDTFSYIVNNLIEKDIRADKVLIFCYSKSECSDILDFFEKEVGDKFILDGNRLVNIYTNISDDMSKSSILKSFSDINGSLRVLVATVAFGLGVNCPNIREVIHFRAPASMLDYIQESGRAGRDGRACNAKLLYSAREFGNRKAKFTRDKLRW